MTIYEHRARERKATAIAVAALAQWRQCLADYDAAEDRHALSSFIVMLAGAGEGMRAAFAANAGQHKPSARTWLRVIAIVSHKSALAQTKEAA